MMSLTAAAIDGEFEKAMIALHRPMAVAAKAAIHEAAINIKERGRANIAAAGFSQKWQNAWRVNEYPKYKASINAAAFAYHKIGYSAVFEDGATIRGKPLLWIPLSSTPKKLSGKRLSVKNFTAQIGPLYSFHSKSGKPFLGAKIPVKSRGVSLASLRAGASLNKLYRIVPVFVGVTAVSIARRFRLRAIIRIEAGNLAKYYAANVI